MTFYESILMCHFQSSFEVSQPQNMFCSKMPIGPCTKCGSFGVASLKLGRMGQNDWGKCKYCTHLRTKLKHVLWLGDVSKCFIEKLHFCTPITRHLVPTPQSKNNSAATENEIWIWWSTLICKSINEKFFITIKAWSPWYAVGGIFRTLLFIYFLNTEHPTSPFLP